jgi:hypothetical protein
VTGVQGDQIACHTLGFACTAMLICGSPEKLNSIKWSRTFDVSVAWSTVKLALEPGLRRYQTFPPQTLDNIGGVGRLAYKYDMASWQYWALVVISELLEKDSASFSSA